MNMLRWKIAIWPDRTIAGVYLADQKVDRQGLEFVYVVPEAELRAETHEWRDRIERVEAENERLRALYDNARSFKARGWSIDHLMECEEALRCVEETAERQYAALKFYADPENYDQYTGAVGESKVGMTARAALGEVE